MTTVNPPIDPEHLLSHAGFLRGLAYGLVVGADRVDDVVQETYLAAVAHPPAARATLRPWLARVARNAAFMAHRRDRRRDRREQQAAREDRTPSAAQILEREGVRKRVVDAVLALDEPYRAAILLRYFEDLAPREVAARLCVPVETVRTRLRRGLERLRTALDERHGGDRRVWAGGLVPLLPRSSTPAVPWGPALAAGLVVAASVGALWAWRPWDRSAADEAVSVGANVPAAAGPFLAARPAPPAPPAGPAAPAASELVSRAGRPLGVLRGFALDGERRPLAGATVLARPTVGIVPDGMSLPPAPGDERTATTDAQGRFHFDGLPSGGYSIVATKAGLGRATAIGFAAPDAPWTDLQFPSLKYAAGTLHVRVVDREQARVPEARIAAWVDAGGPAVEAVSDAEGEVSIGIPASANLGNFAVTFEVTSPRGMARGVAGSWDSIPDPYVEIVIGAPGVLSGRVKAPPGTDLAAFTVRATANSSGARVAHPSLTTHPDSTGAYQFEGVAAGAYQVDVASRGGLRMDVPKKPLWETSPEPSDYVMPSCQVPAGGRGVCDVAMKAGGTLRGRVVRADSGAPVAGARVDVLLPAGAGDHPERARWHGLPVWRLDGPMPDTAQDPVRFRILTTDADGRYETTGLFPSVEYVVRAIPDPTLSFDVQLPVVVEDGRATELTHRVSPAGALELATPSSMCLGIRHADGGALVAILIAPQGPGHGTMPVAVPGLAAGRYDLVNGYGAWDLRRYTSFEIRAGAPTRVDLVQQGASAMHGRVLRAGRPVAGALVQPFISLPWVQTDAEGRFTVALQGGGPLRAGTCEVRPPEPDAVQVRLRVAGVAPEGQPSKDASEARGAAMGEPPPGEDRDLLLPTARLELVATRADGAPAPGVVLSLSGPYVYEVRTTGSDGHARWIGVPAGAFTVKARFPGSDARARLDVEVGDGDLEWTLVEPASSPLVVRVLDVTGRPAAGAVVHLQALPGWSAGQAPPSAAWTTDVRFDDPPGRADATGIARFRGVPNGWIRVNASAGSGWDPGAGHGSFEGRLAPDAPGPVEVRLVGREVGDRSGR